MAATNLFSGHHLDKGQNPMMALVGVAALLYVCAGVGMAYVAGVNKVEHRLDAAQWWRLEPSFGAYRFLTLWAPLPVSLAALPRLRELGERGADTSGRGTRATKGEPALQH